MSLYVTVDVKDPLSYNYDLRFGGIFWLRTHDLVLLYVKIWAV